MTSTTITVTTTPDDHAIQAIGDNLTAFNDADVGPSGRHPLAVLVHSDSGALIAGINAECGWGWLYVKWLWVSESQRGKGLAGRMLAAIENDARRRGCHSAYIDTFSPIALKTYQKAGFVPFGELKDFPTGRTRTFLQKKL